MRSLLPRCFAGIAGLALLAAGCAQQPPPVTTPGATQAPTAAGISSAKSGRTYAVVQLTDSDDALEPFAPAAPGLGAASPDNFHGTDRGAAKTAIVDDASPTTFADLEGLLASGLLVADADMQNHNPPITRDLGDRVAEEQHTVVVTAFLYASTKEKDNDFHCIIGTAPDHDPQFFNVEVSGLPLSGPFRQPLKQVRDTFKAFFGTGLPGRGYKKFNPPIPVRITGSLFYDIDHPPGAVGPGALKPKTAWEIHPVSVVEFEP
jgi:hypothetical protein